MNSAYPKTPCYPLKSPFYHIAENMITFAQGPLDPEGTRYVTKNRIQYEG
jgi:hypothetical protein